jgi:uncharacterized protein (DUF2336 family)
VGGLPDRRRATTHSRLSDLVAEMRRLGFKRRMLITNGPRLTPDLIDALNRTFELAKSTVRSQAGP